MMPSEASGAMRFARELQSRCPSEFIGEMTPIQYGLKLWMRAGGWLFVWFRATELVSKLSCEGAAPTLPILDRLEELLVGPFVEFNRRTAIRATIVHWKSSATVQRTAVPSERLVSSAGSGTEQDGSRTAAEPSESTGLVDDDPLAAIKPTGTIGVRRVGRAWSGASPDGLGGSSGWSQEIGRRCEQFALEWIGARFGDTRIGEAGSLGQLRLRIDTGDRLLIWLNAEHEQGHSWDIEERDANTGEILRRHEVKSRTGELTESEHALAIQHGDAYMIWRVDPDAGVSKRLEAPTNRPLGNQMESRELLSMQSTNARRANRECIDQANGPTLFVLGSSTHDFGRTLRRQHAGFVGRYRGNLVVVLHVTPELELVLPGSKSRLWIANRSRAGCALANDAMLQLGVTALSPLLAALLVVAVEIHTQRGTERALRLASKAGAFGSAKLSGGKQ